MSSARTQFIFPLTGSQAWNGIIVSKTQYFFPNADCEVEIVGRKKQDGSASSGGNQRDLTSDPESGNLFPDRDSEWVTRVRSRLVDWFGGAGRKLPWREDHDPYRILVSEMMLVQTTVAAVIPYFARFLQQFPTVRDLAEADEADVLKAWEGLGYYRRARQLQAAARSIMEDHSGRFPDDPEAIRALPGVGRYIAGAVLSFAFDRAAPIVEANTQRVLARWLAWGEDLKSTRSQARLWEAAGRMVPEAGAGAFNQAFMELGALVCIPKAPLCLACPVSGDCLSRKLGVQDRIPVASPKVPPKVVTEACAMVERGGAFLIVKRASGRLWEHFWEFPTIHLAGADPASRSTSGVELTEGVFRLTGIRASIGPVAKTVRFGVTNHRVTLEAHAGLVDAAWEPLETLGRHAMSSSNRQLVAWLGSH
jgi:A/G-specific adenine glycosylase